MPDFCGLPFESGFPKWIHGLCYIDLMVLTVCVYDVLLSVVRVLADLQVDFVRVDTHERSVKEHFCVLPFSQNA